MSDRDDERFVGEFEPAVLHGWMEVWDGDRCEASVQMGGWTDDDEEAYRSAIEDEIAYWEGSEPSEEDVRIEIHATSPRCCDSWSCPCGDRHCDGEDCAAASGE